MVLYIAIVKDNFKSIIYIYNYSLCDNHHNEIKLNTFIYIIHTIFSSNVHVRLKSKKKKQPL